ncbi:MAG: hypothetical protein Q4D96_12360 [Propionibacteriaceae bacterium]|nr:hypothetical protein [Propionibacteriaceae bacterium]
MAVEQADQGAMIRAAGRVEASHQQIHELQMRLQDDLPRLATVLDGNRFVAFQRDYSHFDSQIERVKQGLDLVHSSLTGQGRPRVVVAMSLESDPPPSPEFPTGLPDGASELAGANAELNSVLNSLSTELAESMPSWVPEAREAWQEARRSWVEANRRQSEILTQLGDRD